MVTFYNLIRYGCVSEALELRYEGEIAIGELSDFNEFLTLC